MKNIQVGIDLGTVNTCVATFNENKVNIIHINNERITPSYVYYDPKSSNVYIGTSAEKKNQKDVIYDAKRFIGRRYEDPIIQEIRKNYPFKITQGPDNNIYFRVDHNNKVVKKKPEDVSAELLKYIKDEVLLKFETDEVEAVITVPAHFNNNQREKTKKAAEKAGVKVLKLMNEPTAAALCYFHGGFKKDLRAMVFDLGGGTLDVSVIDINNDEITVKTTDGDTFLGGRNFDENVMNYFKEKINEDGQALSILQLARLKVSARKLKENLSFYENAEDTIMSFVDDEDKDLCLDRSTFEMINQEDFERCIKIIKRCLDKAEIQKTDIDEVIMIGGSSKIPKIQEMLQDFFGKTKLMFDVDPDEAVAGGAAVQAFLLQGNTDVSADALNKLVITDVTPATLGIEEVFGVMSPIIEKNSQLPVSNSKKYNTSVNYQTECLIRVFEGQRKCTKFNNVLGEIHIGDIPRKLAGDIKVEVTFTIDNDGILNVKAKCEGREKDLAVAINQFDLDGANVAGAVEDGDDYDKEFEKFVEAKEKLMTMCNDYDTEEADEFSKILFDTDLEDIERISEAIKVLRNSAEITFVVTMETIWREYLEN